MSRTTRLAAARRQGEDRYAAMRLRQLAIAEALAARTTTEEGTVAESGTQPATEPREVTVRTIVQMTRAFPGMDCPAASRLFTEADQAYREGPAAADTLGVFLAEVRSPATGALEAGARYRVRKISHRVYRVTPEPVDE